MRRSLGLVALALAVTLSLRAAPDTPGTQPARSPVEADWLMQAQVRTLPAGKGASSVTTQEDAAGAVDGVKDGKWGFHTQQEAKGAWWQVDLGKNQAIARVVVYNRCDTPERIRGFQLLLSNDGKSWQTAYRYGGPGFRGATDSQPLAVDLKGAEGRFVRVQGAPGQYLHLDELEVCGPADPKKNLALHQPADQSSVSQWSVRHVPGAAAGEIVYPLAQTLERGRALAADLRRAGVDTSAAERVFDEVGSAGRAGSTAAVGVPSVRTADLYFKLRAAIRQLTFANPLLDFDRVLFVKRAPGSYSHMSDQYYSWWARPGGGVYLLEGIRSGNPTLRCLTASFPEGSFLSPDLSYDGKKVLFAYCRYYKDRAAIRNKLDKDAQPEDSFYHVFEMNVDGGALRQITKGRYDDTFPRYLPNGEIVFLSTRRGTFLQCNKAAAMATLDAALPDSFVRCGGDAYRPVAIYTLHVIDAHGGNLRPISAFESFEWDPTVTADGRIFYARWDYVDRSNMPYMKLWVTHSDGTHPQIVWGNYTTNPHCIFEARSIPGSRRILATASGHHSITAGSLVLIDPTQGKIDGLDVVTRLTPEVCFPEAEGWPKTWYAHPYPLSEKYYLTSWSNQPLLPEGNRNNVSALGIYLCDAFGNLELLHRDPAIGSAYPLPVKARPAPPVVASNVEWEGPQEGRFLVQNVYEGLRRPDGTPFAPGTIKALRVVAMPVKVQPNMNTPPLGATADDPGKCVLGEATVEADGSAYFRVPSGVAVFFQALDETGAAVQTMRSLTYVQPGQTASCVGCHEDRASAPARRMPLALRREASKLKPGPDGSWPLRFDALVQPALDKHCVSCHSPNSRNPANAQYAAAAKFDLTAGKAYESLFTYGRPSLRDHVRGAYDRGRSIAGAGAAHTSPVLRLLREGKDGSGHYGVKLDPESFRRLTTWMDTYGQRQGHFSPQQEEELRQFRTQVAELLTK